MCGSDHKREDLPRTIKKHTGNPHQRTTPKRSPEKGFLVIFLARDGISLKGIERTNVQREPAK
jgi:hypothetical protein